MPDKRFLSALSFIAVALLVATLAWLTQSEEPDPCASSQRDISAAVLADGDGDQSGMVNRAIIVGGDCEK